jgi:hypothetical protein
VKQYLLAFFLAVLVVLAGLSLRRTVFGMGSSPVPVPPYKAVMGSSPVPVPPYSIPAGQVH